MTQAAQFESICKKCNELIEIRDSIARISSGWVHASCAGRTNKRFVKKSDMQFNCKKCFTTRKLTQMSNLKNICIDCFF